MSQPPAKMFKRETVVLSDEETIAFFSKPDCVTWDQCAKVIQKLIAYKFASSERAPQVYQESRLMNAILKLKTEAESAPVPPKAEVKKA